MLCSSQACVWYQMNILKVCPINTLEVHMNKSTSTSKRMNDDNDWRFEKQN